MARPRAFEVDGFFDQAMAVFWAKGFAAASMADIYAATGLGPGSVYALVRDKDDLFRQVFERYAAGFRETMRSDASGLPALEAWMDIQLAFLTGDPDRRGCLIANTIMERHAHSPETLALADARIQEIRAFFAANITAGLADGSVRRGVRVSEAADALLGSVTGLMALARGRVDVVSLRNIAHAALDALRPQQRRPRVGPA